MLQLCIKISMMHQVRRSEGLRIKPYSTALTEPGRDSQGTEGC